MPIYASSTSVTAPFAGTTDINAALNGKNEVFERAIVQTKLDKMIIDIKSYHCYRTNLA